ncbi:hypothetical protein [Pararhizobium haloflavum]|uniref:hypothetical protein n=1 Tax=Pararhizobium haloflavum TaxID=2037914 RepID=UPI000C189DF5|nr:hypothetical protein [Pararhizobium haloflavum]
MKDWPADERASLDSFPPRTIEHDGSDDDRPKGWDKHRSCRRGGRDAIGCTILMGLVTVG